MGEYRSEPAIEAEFADIKRRLAAIERLAAPTYVYAGPFSGPQDIASGAETALEFFNVSRSYNFTVSGTQVMIVAPGYYLVTSNPVFASNATGRRSARVVLNDATEIAGASANAVNGDATRLSCAGFHEFQGGDYLRLMLYQNSGAALGVIGEGSSKATRALALLRVPH